MNLLLGVLTIWVPSAFFNVIFFLIIHKSYEKLNTYLNPKLILKTLVFVFLAIVFNALFKSLVSIYSVSGILATIMHIVLFHYIFGANWRKSITITVVMMYVIMNMEVITFSLYFMNGGGPLQNNLLLSIPTRIAQFLLIIAVIKMSMNGTFKQNMISDEWSSLDKQQKINVTLMTCLQCVVIFINISSIDKLFNEFYGKAQFTASTFDLLYMFLSTIVLSIIVMFVTMRMTLFQHFHTIAKTVKDEPLILFENLIQSADEKEQAEYVQVVVNSLKLVSHKELIDFCDFYAKALPCFEYSIDEGMVEGLKELGIQVKLFRYIMNALECEMKDICAISAKFMYEDGKDECELAVSVTDPEVVCKVQALLNGARYCDYSSALESQGYSVCKAIHDKCIAISINKLEEVRV